MINIIQVILTIGILVIGIYSFKKLRSSAIDALFILLIVCTGILFIFFPELSNKVAHLLGVGRGADMIFYLSILFFGFLILKLYSKVRKIEQILTQVIREKSLVEAKMGNNE